MTKATHRKKTRLILLDAHAIIHRAYHALPDFSSTSGEPTGALYGLSAMLFKIAGDLKPDYIVACYDLPKPTYRHEVYKDYKAGRRETDDELSSQLDRSRDIFEVFNIPIYEHEGFEADDVLGTIVEKQKNNKNIEIIIASGDMDTLQLVDKKKVQVYTLRKGITDTILYDEEAVIDRFGFPPELLPDFKGLRGDPSDNIIGIRGIGEKTATILIQNFGTIESMYKILKKSEKPFEKAGIKPRIIRLLKDNEEEALFSKMLGEIRRDVPINFSLPTQKWHESVNVETIIDLFADLNFRTLSNRARNFFGYKQATLISVNEKTLSPKEEKELALALWVLRSDISLPEHDDILQFTRKKDILEARSYIFQELKKNKTFSVYEKIELPLIPIIEEMEKKGIKLDLKYIKKLSKEYHSKLSKIEGRIYKYAGEKFNINSPRQLGNILFEKMDLSIKNHKKTSTGQKSTRESELEKMKEEHPIIKEILAYRELQKLLSTYIDNLPKLVDKQSRIHTTLLQAGTTTGRMSSRNPNLQNIPIKSELGRNIRKAFVAKDGYELVSLDYSQIELRIASILSRDKKLMGIFKSGGDVHQAVAKAVFNVAGDRVDAEMRRKAKIINFGILYGMGVNALRANLQTDRKEAQEFYNEYFRQYEGLASYLDNIKASAAKLGYTETLFGRRRYFEDIRSRLPHIRAHAERMAINAPIQGTSADVIKIAMKQVADYIVKNKLEENVRLLLQVHDELVFEIKTSLVKKVALELKKIMENILSQKQAKGVPLVVEVKYGGNWGELKSM
ncbi:hypothetical protein IIB51_00915 [Patescibacteria group bacterium]|nr:hypothetical protein [Patescibacteria group bacterium]